jgi:ribosome-associated translation inhibitor RaiA
MNIEFNTDHNIEGKEGLTAPLMSIIDDKLSNFSNHIQKVEVHLTDEDASKDGRHDKRCLLEAHVQGIPSIVVSDHAKTHEQAVSGAIEKMKTSLDTILGRIGDRY